MSTNVTKARWGDVRGMWYHGAAMLCIVFYMLPYFILGQDSYITIDDNLDSNFIWQLLLSRSDLLFADSATLVPPLLGGVPRVVLGSEFDYIVWLFALLSPFTAYVVNKCIIHGVAYCGAWLLLRRYVMSQSSAMAVAATALCFAVLPFWPMAGLTVAGLPLLLWAFCNLLTHRQLRTSVGIFLLMPFGASLVLAYVHVLMLLFVTVCVLWARGREVRWALGALVAMAVMFALVEYRLVQWLLEEPFVSHRSEMLRSAISWSHGMERWAKHFFRSFGHVKSLHAQVFLLLGVYAGTFGLKRVWRNRPVRWLLIAQMLASAIFCFYNLEVLITWRAEFPLLRTFDFSRFYWLCPLGWLVVLGLLLRDLLATRRRALTVVLGFMCVAQLGYSTLYHEHWKNEFGERRELRQTRGTPTFRQFFAQDLFSAIKRDLPPVDEYNVVSVGMHPASAQYNGFHTFDGYLSLYPLAHKQKMRTLIHEELSRANPYTRWMFESWGHRCYAFSSEIGYRMFWKKDSGFAVRDLRWNATALRENNIRYIFSSVPILNAADFQFAFMNAYESGRSFWRLYVYRATWADE